MPKSCTEFSAEQVISLAGCPFSDSYLSWLSLESSGCFLDTPEWLNSPCMAQSQPQTIPDSLEIQAEGHSQCFMLQHHSSSPGLRLETDLNEPALPLKSLSLLFCSPILGSYILRRIFPIHPNEGETDYPLLRFPDCRSWERWEKIAKTTVSKRGLSRTMMNGLEEACAYSHSIIRCWLSDSRQEGRRHSLLESGLLFLFLAEIWVSCYCHSALVSFSRKQSKAA